MGAVCDSCFGGGNTTKANEKTSLLYGQTSGTRVNPRLAAYDERATPVSARCRSPEPSQPQDALQSNVRMGKVQLDHVGIAGIDKRLQDHVQLYNDILDKRKELIEDVRELRQASRTSVMTLEVAFKYIRSKTGGDKANLKRKSQHSMEIIYDPSEMNPDVHRLFLLFNKINRLCKELIEKTPSLQHSVELLVSEEDKFKREILLASLESKDGVDAMHLLMKNISTLRVLPNNIESIRKAAEEQWQELLRASAELVK